MLCLYRTNSTLYITLHTPYSRTAVLYHVHGGAVLYRLSMTRVRLRYRARFYKPCRPGKQMRPLARLIPRVPWCMPHWSAPRCSD